MKVLIFGPNGFFGNRFKDVYPDAETSDADIANQSAVSEALDDAQPEVVINCAGKTGRPNVDWCEDHKEETLRSNLTGPKVLLEECGKRNIYWVHLSTGCVYEGDKGGEGFCEEDPPNFFGSYYSKVKGEIDQYLKDYPVLQLRLRMPFENFPHPRNLITKLTKYERVIDIPNSITYVPDALNAAEILIGKKKTGIYNMVNPGAISPYGVMKLYKEMVDPSHEFELLPLKDLPTAVKAERSNCILSTKKLESEGIPMTNVEEAVKNALKEYSMSKKVVQIS
jgi:3,5-epimerase/4-reductase